MCTFWILNLLLYSYLPCFGTEATVTPPYEYIELVKGELLGGVINFALGPGMIFTDVSWVMNCWIDSSSTCSGVLCFA